MNTAHLIHDPELPVAATLLSRSAIDVLAPFVALGGGVVQGFRPTRVSYRPGRRIAVTYDVAVNWAGRPAQETVVAVADLNGLPPSTVTVEAGDVPVGVWRASKDPYLPGLGLATDPVFVRDLLDEIGAPPGKIALRTRSYWASRRAVVEVTTTPPKVTDRLVFRPGYGITRPNPESVMYLKVVRPARAAQFAGIHELLSDVAPVARCRYCSERDGLLVLDPLPGDTLWDCVRRGRYPPPDGRKLIELLDCLGDADIPRSRRMTSRESARASAPLLRAVIPEEVARIDCLVDRLGVDRGEPTITIHGDFHEVQVLVDRDGVSGLLDLDDVGPGQRIDDLAMMAGRFWSFAPFEKRGRERIAQYALDLMDTFSQFADPDDLHERVACVLLARATSPFRSQTSSWPRDTRRAVQLAERWLDGSGRTIEAMQSA